MLFGFSMPKLWGEHPTFAMPSKDGFVFMFKQAELEDTIAPSRDQRGFWDAYVWINAAEPCSRNAGTAAL